MEFIQEQLLFFVTIFIVLFLPGLTLLHSFFKLSFTQLELFVFSLPVSIVLVDFIMMLLGKSGVLLTATSILSGIVALCIFVFLISKFIPNNQDTDNKKEPVLFSKKQGWLIILILALTLFIKTVYLAQVILPTATDLGHHMYWSKLITTTGELPQYVERNIIESDGEYILDAPEKIDDFIIGEHLVFAAISLISGMSFISGFPATILLLVNFFTVLAIFLFVTRAFTSIAKSYNISTNVIGIATILFLGPIYTLASPQAKFVSGGVIGNTIGNLLIPTVLYMYWRALQEKSSKLLTLSFLLTFGLAYTHHLSTFIFLFIFFFTLAFFCIFHIQTIHTYIAQWFKIIFKLAPIIFAISAIAFFLFVIAPSYADPKSLDTAIGTPTKTTRTGLTFLQMTFSTGEGRLGIGLVGLIILLALQFRKGPKKTSIDYTIAFFFAWGFALFIMSLRPQWLFIDIPSNRISSYAVFPFAILSALAFTLIFKQYTENNRAKISNAAFLVILTFFIIGGFYDNSQSLLTKTKAQEAVQTYQVSDYLAQHTTENDLILKDHNYIISDSWMKLSFMRGYTYPLSRGLLRRYEDETKPREQCTLWMIAVPNTTKGEKCFKDTGVNIVVINPHYDSVQFEKSNNFSSIYKSNDVAVYARKQH